MELDHFKLFGNSVSNTQLLGVKGAVLPCSQPIRGLLTIWLGPFAIDTMLFKPDLTGKNEGHRLAIELLTLCEWTHCDLHSTDFLDPTWQQGRSGGSGFIDCYVSNGRHSIDQSPGFGASDGRPSAH